ncbi:MULTISPECIES: 2-polyprenyl-3-methyl-6-methoxy-1,4-benzoquinone monooxygenase [unclassified Halomonas]|uniref:2-polyprenyl-3-methyl-6-methoxy-1,4-benzoquinone monooxygenase n=1 Tax=unclassified Halomonas TaxID=2609666 RepID=UPI001CF5D06B|nr:MULTISPECIES: 2-polyprenyl-3-methyl-6-methoxy-1,4-benzoquinone monooxygenase [unclassified Halomonas]MCA8866876.1 2-polyprenyl-3-methyl-6-methoxy-1,4-benzoquinone monooxygenase [Halomonas sp. SBBP1]UZH08546.1 2-polyprenyl-3-methyl-6-methoxy-1,4-benzoquinone monooxygenase [Halomonas sp. BDJS001]
MDRQQSRSDRLIHQFDTALRTLMPHAASPQRISPGEGVVEVGLDDQKRRHAAGLMRINHTREVCAQALYQGQGVTAKLPHARHQMEQSALEKIDHLAWCDDRLEQLQSRTSCLNPLFYVASFGVGAAAGAVSDRISLGLVAATEEQAGKQLAAHQQSLPSGDNRSRAILRQMAVDEAHHAQLALEAGGVRFPAPVKWGMRLASKAMTKSVYHL